MLGIEFKFISDKSGGLISSLSAGIRNISVLSWFQAYWLPLEFMLLAEDKSCANESQVIMWLKKLLADELQEVVTWNGLPTVLKESETLSLSGLCMVLGHQSQNAEVLLALRTGGV